MHIRAILAAFAACYAASAADLKPETIAAWDDYIRGAQQSMQDRLNPDRRFLWIDEVPARASQVRAGRVLAAPIADHFPQHVSSGLIHHWIGAAFLPDASLDDALALLRDYSRYKEFFHPAVIDSKSISVGESIDRFSLVLMNKAVLVKTALDTEEQSRYWRVSSRRAYGISQTTRIQEIENYAQPSERKLPPDHGNGYIWRIYSITRLEERDGGVYFEAEAMALSRDIPAAVRIIVDPIVRRVSKSSMLTSLRQTQDALAASRSKSVLANRQILPH